MGDDIKKAFNDIVVEPIKQTIDVAKDVANGAANGIAAPVNLVIDIAKGQNAVQAMGARGVEFGGVALPGITAVSSIAQEDRVRQFSEASGPYTFGFTEKLQNFSDMHHDATVEDKQLSSQEQFTYYRDGAEIAGVVVAGSAAVGAYESGAATGLGATATEYAPYAALVGPAEGLLRGDINPMLEYLGADFTDMPTADDFKKPGSPNNFSYPTTTNATYTAPKTEPTSFVKILLPVAILGIASFIVYKKGWFRK